MNKSISEFFSLEVISSLILSLLWPTLGLLYVVILVIRRKKSSRTIILSLMLVLSLFLSYINSTKTATSDTIYYLEWFTNIDRLHPIQSFLSYGEGNFLYEPLFAIISITMNYLTLGSEVGYLFLCSFLIYFLQFYALYVVADYYKISSSIILVLIAMLAFLNPLFIQTIHAIRQMIAASFLMMAVAKRIVSKRSCWVYIMMAIFTHLSTIVFIPIFVLPQSYKRISAFSVLLVSALVFLGLGVYDSFGNLLSSMSSEEISQVGNKILDSAEHNEMKLSLKGFYLYCIPFALLAAYSAFSNNGAYPKISIYYYLFFITFCIVVLNPISTGVSIRYSFYVYSFLPYTAMVYCLTNRRTAPMILPILSIMIVAIFFILLSRDNSYADILTILFKPLPLFI